MFLKLLVVLALMSPILSINVSYADTQDAERLNNNNQTLLLHLNNISMIARAMEGNERNVAFDIHTDALRIHEKTNDLVDLETLQNQMESANDKAIVKARIIERVADMKGGCELSIVYLNEIIVSIQNRALSSEAQRAKNDVVQSCDILQHWK